MRVEPSARRARVAVLLCSAAAAALALAACARRPEPYAIDSTDPATLRTTPSGKLVGGRGRYDAAAWLGIPYAKPPVGALRWRAPEPPAAWAEVREALH